MYALNVRLGDCLLCLVAEERGVCFERDTVLLYVVTVWLLADNEYEVRATLYILACFSLISIH
jgi:hypothetical protein